MLTRSMVDASSRSASTGVPSQERTGCERWDALIGRASRVLIACLVLWEVSVRLIDWKDGRDATFYLPPSSAKSIVEPHPFIGFVQTPGWDRAGGYQMHINSLGMRGKEMTVEKPAGVKRILCAGGSTTFCTGATRDDRTWPGQLELLLNETSPPGVRYEVGNIGVSGYSSVENLIDFELRRVDLAPDYFVFYGATNDARAIQAVRGAEFEPDYTNLRRVWAPDELPPLETFLLGHVRSYARLTRGTNPEKQFGALVDKLYVDDYGKLNVRSDERVNLAGVATFVRNLQHMVWICRAHRIQPILCTIAQCLPKLDPKDERFVETVLAMNQGVRQLAAAEKVPLIDIARELSDKPELYDDLVHHNDAGCRAFAEVLLADARSQGLFPAK
jgi:lysophospholipase L1-like esterase